MSSIRKAYKTILKDPFPAELVLEVAGQRLHFQKRRWTLPGEDGAPRTEGLRYGDNPDQPAALYRWTEGELTLEGNTLVPGGALVSGLTEAHFIQFGKHPGKTNLTDLDAGIRILTPLAAAPAAVIIKHNNPCGVACADNILQAYEKAYFADRIAAMGGCIVLNRTVDEGCARAIAAQYAEVVAAPDYEDGAVGILRARENLRIIRLPELGALEGRADELQLHLSSTSDGGIVLQLAQLPLVRSTADFRPAEHAHKGTVHSIGRAPSAAELADLFMAWHVCANVTSNAIVMVRDRVTTAIGTGEQDRVGAVRLAIEKAYTKRADQLAFERHGISIFELELAVGQGRIAAAELEDLKAKVREEKGGLAGSVMASDGFFPFRDAVDAACAQGVTAFAEPGGAMRDHEVIDACNGHGAALVFTNQRVFRH